ncbi:MAG: 50S ribosome-binding GTPase [Phycisphaerales bacterium]|nr:50S ribosome-binding GTPase [Phycisphaerales bacterium]
MSCSFARGEDLGILRLITCGSVDDGKSTLIGRLLLDTKQLRRDTLEAIDRTSKARGGSTLDLALITDGLRAEREQGITIDVAYRSFSTPRRRFILGDTPGHVQYTRNMATAASTADAAIILVDVRQGVVEQTRRHACIAVLLGVRHLIVCVNKMDLIGFDRAQFERVREDFTRFALATEPDGSGPLAARAETTFIPISALRGDHVAAGSSAMPWHAEGGGPTLLSHLESLPDHAADEGTLSRFCVQYIIRPQTSQHHDYRGYAGQIASGSLRVGDSITAMPSGLRSRITRMHVGTESLPAARAPQSIAIELADDLDLTRGELLVPENAPNPPRVAGTLEATLVWMSPQPLTPGKRLLVKHTARTITGVVKTIQHRLDMTTLQRVAAPPTLALNEIGQVTIRLGQEIACDAYRICRGTGAFILIDEQTNNTVAAGMIV